MRIAVLAAAASAAVLAAVGVSSASTSHASRPAAHVAATAAPLSVGLVTDVGGLNDRSFNHLAYVGLQRAAAQGIKTKVMQSKSGSDYIPNLSTLAAQHYNLVIAVGFLMTDAVKAVSKQFPNTKFAIIDVTGADAGGGKNVEGLVFHEEQSGYVAGYLAGLMEKVKNPRNNSANVVSTVGGIKIPPVDHYIAGFIAGAKAADPGVTELNGYSGSFTDAAKCKSIANTQLAKGSDVVFAVAGGCGLGAIGAAKSKGVWAVGVDADQGYLGPMMLTSAIKRVDQAVYSTIIKAKGGVFTNGTTTFGIAQNGAGIASISKAVPASVKAKLAVVIKNVKAGKVSIPNTVK